MRPSASRSPSASRRSESRDILEEKIQSQKGIITFCVDTIQLTKQNLSAKINDAELDQAYMESLYPEYNPNNNYEKLCLNLLKNNKKTQRHIESISKEITTFSNQTRLIEIEYDQYSKYVQSVEIFRMMTQTSKKDNKKK